MFLSFKYIVIGNKYNMDGEKYGFKMYKMWYDK